MYKTRPSNSIVRRPAVCIYFPLKRFVKNEKNGRKRPDGTVSVGRLNVYKTDRVRDDF